MRPAMRTLLIATVLLASPDAWARKPYGMAGCGLGSLIIAPSGSQSSAATTNGSTYNQLFGITSGTSNCKPTEESAAIMDQEQFVVTNLATLSKEMAQGSGETLAAFSEKLGCGAAYPTFAAHVQTNYAAIFKAPGALAVLDATKESLTGDPVLGQSCTGLLM